MSDLLTEREHDRPDLVGILKVLQSRCSVPDRLDRNFIVNRRDAALVKPVRELPDVCPALAELVDHEVTWKFRYVADRVDSVRPEFFRGRAVDPEHIRRG